MIKYNYWDVCAQKIIDKYVKLMKEARIVFSDGAIGIKCCYKYKTPELERRCTESIRIFDNIDKEIDKFPRRCRGMIYAALRKFKL